jgi:23S rRNA (uracil1939-C5)-methyltransferase
VEDLRHNATGLDHVEVHRIDVRKAGKVLADHVGATVIADPPRVGLEKRGVEVVLGVRPACIVLVSCDPASLGRDTRLLMEGGYRLVESTPLDMFPQTFHVEVVSRFEPA